MHNPFLIDSGFTQTGPHTAKASEVLLPDAITDGGDSHQGLLAEGIGKVLDQRRAGRGAELALQIARKAGEPFQ